MKGVQGALQPEKIQAAARGASLKPPEAKTRWKKIPTGKRVYPHVKQARCDYNLIAPTQKETVSRSTPS